MDRQGTTAQANKHDELATVKQGRKDSWTQVQIIRAGQTITADDKGAVVTHRDHKKCNRTSSR